METGTALVETIIWVALQAGVCITTNPAIRGAAGAVTGKYAVIGDIVVEKVPLMARGAVE